MGDQRTNQKGGRTIARAFVWLAIAFLVPLGCLALYNGITKQRWDVIAASAAYAGFAVLFLFGLTTKQFP
jgi:hypothetical protein